jgi:hypothetical protein
MIEQPAEVDEMLLRGLPLGERGRAPFVDELLGGHDGVGWSENNELSSDHA